MGRGIRPHGGGGPGIVLAAAMTLVTVAPWAHAAEHAVRAGSLLEARVRVFVTGPQQIFTLGGFAGRVAVEGPPSALDGARLSCPASFDADYGAKTLRGDGRCVVTAGSGDRLFLRWTCAGVPDQGCAGRYAVTGGTGAFQGATGEGELAIRLVLSSLIQLDRQEAEYDITGQITWPELRFRTP